MRIRTVKPSLFRHEGLQDLETDHPGAYAMLTFIGLFCAADANGVFEWKPRTLKLDVLPFLGYDLEKTLTLLVDNGYLTRYETEGNTYGHITNFKKHQRITGREYQEGGRLPTPPLGGKRTTQNSRRTPTTTASAPVEAIADDAPAYRPTIEMVTAHMTPVIQVATGCSNVVATEKAHSEAAMFIAHYNDADWRTKTGDTVTDWHTLAEKWAAKAKLPKTPPAGTGKTAKPARSWNKV